MLRKHFHELVESVTKPPEGALWLHFLLYIKEISFLK